MKTKFTKIAGKLLLIAVTLATFSGIKAYAQTLSLTQPDQAAIYKGNFITNVTIYPRPTHNIVTIQGVIAAQANIDLMVTDILGRRIIERTENVTIGLYQRQLDLSSYPNGIYLLEIRSGDQAITTRLIKD